MIDDEAIVKSIHREVNYAIDCLISVSNECKNMFLGESYTLEKLDTARVFIEKAIADVKDEMKE